MFATVTLRAIESCHFSLGRGVVPSGRTVTSVIIFPYAAPLVIGIFIIDKK